ncbi:uncharacterized protein LOC119090032 [Pollicipes pollicipes]|uniref:uncharacterized protein LOC119090032 n=1 Tax=Pollicipes pollicipes TaxID=41117 RepID=UPI0018858CC1|nr:uncharacterized protein LOC119090032 [Pollicipes pollicipes]
MERHLRNQRRVIPDRKEFYTRLQADGESFDNYMMVLKELAEFCDFCAHCMDDRLKDRIVTGIWLCKRARRSNTWSDYGERQTSGNLHVNDVRVQGVTVKKTPQVSVLKPDDGDPTPAQKNLHLETLKKAFPRVFSTQPPLREMSGGPMRIDLRPDARPYAETAARHIPHAWRDDIKHQVDDLIAQDVITPVAHPTEWCHPMVQVPKPPTDRSHGKTYFKRAVMGLCTSGDEYGRFGDAALAGLPKTNKVVDDILAYRDDYSTHLLHVTQILQRCDSHGITLNPAKRTLAVQTLDFCGYVISPDGYTADQRKVRAIADFPVPENLTDLRSFMGLVNQLGAFSTDTARTAKPLRDLLRPRNQ